MSPEQFYLNQAAAKQFACLRQAARGRGVPAAGVEGSEAVAERTFKSYGRACNEHR